MPHTARARSDRIWPPGAGVLSRHRPHVSPAAPTMPVMRRRGERSVGTTALRRVDGITVSGGMVGENARGAAVLYWNSPFHPGPLEARRMGTYVTRAGQAGMVSRRPRLRAASKLSVM